LEELRSERDQSDDEKGRSPISPKPYHRATASAADDAMTGYLSGSSDIRFRR
jgi:hypothetical protein